MPLEDYQNKRDFKKTPEPEEGGVSKPAKKLSFVVQKHYASRLHFDLRLELGQALKSWAVPKGPTMNPKEKKLAVMVEDHPLDYKDFQGVIPEGNYGAGEVFIWDRGTYHPYGAKDTGESIEKMKEGLKEGHLTFILDGDILKGEFALIKLKKGEQKDWLLIKKNDKFAKDTDITKIKTPSEGAGGKKKIIRT